MIDLLGLMLPDNENLTHWQGARAGRVLVQKCCSCMQLRFPAAVVCAKCGSNSSEWVATDTTGRVLAWCRFHRGYFKELEEKLPYTVLLVELDSGIKLYANLASGELDTEIEIGTAVEAVFEPVDDQLGLVKFRRLHHAKET